jgi:methyl-accepting chemotaxis protein
MTGHEEPAGADNALARAVAVNERVKEVRGKAGEVELVALNAVLAAHRAGGHARGFGVVSGELRALSDGLNAAARELVAVIAGMVRDTAQALKQRHRLRLLNRANPGGALAGLLGRKHGELAQQEQTLRAAQRRAAGQVAGIWRLSVLGQGLARNAGIEASHSGQYAAALRQVAGAIQAAVAQMAAAVDRTRLQIEA